MSEIVSYKIDEALLNQIKEHYSLYEKENTGEYIVFFASYEGISISIYESKKGYTVVFMGNGALKEAQLFNKDAEPIEKKEKEIVNYLSLNTQMGSDEVGVGDFLLPMIVVAAYVTKDEMSYLLKLGIKDSKKLKDSDILELAPLLIAKFSFSKLTLHNEKYNEMIAKGENLNSLKAKLHNKALSNLKKKYPNTKEIYIDEFCSPKKYFSYLEDQDEVIKDITFHTKGESYFPSVALASVIARYCFLKEKKILEEKYGMQIPFGASKKVNEFCLEFIKKYSLEELEKISKNNFKNLEQIKESL